MELVQLIDALTNPACYPFSPKQVEVRQTHISIVFLAGPFAYKIKKPVDMGFLDFSTLAKRRHFCAEEVRLNRRLAPSVYLGVVPVTQTGAGVRMEDTGEPIEWAVKMQRLPESATLLEFLRRGEVDAERAESLGRRVASFHQSAERSPAIAAFGRFEAVARNLRDIYSQSAAQAGQTVSRAVFDRLQVLTEEALARLQPLIDRRASQGMTCDTHGDLHLDHVYLFPEKQPPDDLVIIDCIEFNERFRFTDPIADMAFPVMDFAYHGRRDLARAFAESYFRATGDDEGRALLPLYTAYRATVRGSVEGLKLAEKEITEADRAASLQKSQGHWLLALGELEEPDRRPCLVLVGGLPGTGKSSLAAELATRKGFQVIRSDVVRKELAGLPADAPTPEPLRAKLYALDFHTRTYAECLRRAEQALFEGKRIVVDATFREEHWRRTFLDSAWRWGVPGVILVCRASPETVRHRLEKRRQDASDAEWLTYQQLARQWEEPSPATREVLHLMDMDKNQEQILGKASALLPG